MSRSTAKKGRGGRKTKISVVGLAVALLVALLQSQLGENAPVPSTPEPSQQLQAPAAPAPGKTRSDDARIARAVVERRSGFMATLEGRVAKVLPDDREGSRHQRFILELTDGHTLLVAHNIDLARRVPLSRGERLRLRGQYEWNDRGGVIHWTHHDPDGRHDEGWIEHRDVVYE